MVCMLIYFCVMCITNMTADVKAMENQDKQPEKLYKELPKIPKNDVVKNNNEPLENISRRSQSLTFNGGSLYPNSESQEKTETDIKTFVKDSKTCCACTCLHKSVNYLFKNVFCCLIGGTVCCFEVCNR